MSTAESVHRYDDARQLLGREDDVFALWKAISAADKMYDILVPLIASGDQLVSAVMAMIEDLPTEMDRATARVGLRLSLTGRDY